MQPPLVEAIEERIEERMSRTENLAAKRERYLAGLSIPYKRCTQAVLCRGLE